MKDNIIRIASQPASRKRASESSSGDEQVLNKIRRGHVGGRAPRRAHGHERGEPRRGHAALGRGDERARGRGLRQGGSPDPIGKSDRINRILDIRSR